MRLDIDEIDNYRHADRDLFFNCKVLLDGKEVRFCTVADEEQGYIEKYMTDEDGRIECDGDGAKTETLKGKVEIVDLRKQ